MRTHAATSLLRVLLALLLGAAALFATALPAGAHASVRQTTPFDGERIAPGDTPAVVTIEYNEAVEVPPDGIRVFDAAGARVDTDAPVPGADDPFVAGVALQPDLADGSYVVTWRAVSADGHPIRGAFVFTVGAAAEASDTVVADLLSGDGDTIALVQRVATSLTYAAVPFVVGALLAGRVLGRAASARSADWVRRALHAGVALTVLAVPLQAMAASGDGLAAVLDGAQLWAVLTASVGVAAVVRLVGLVGVLLTEGRPRVVAGLVALGSFLVDGHTRTVDPGWVMVVGDALHLLAGAIWFGGLVVLLRELRARQLIDDPVGGATMLAGWSRLALWSVAGVVAGGVAMAWATVRDPVALVSTTYGQLLQVKVLLALVVIGMGAWNHFRLVPRVQEAVPVPAGGATATEPTTGSADAVEDVRVRTGLAWLRLRRTVRWEVGVLLVILLVTGVLQNERPAAEALGIGGTFQVTEELTEELNLDIVVDPNVAGQNAIHLYLLNDADRTVSDVEGVTMELSLPEQDIGPIERDPVVTGPGHWVLNGRELALPGTWELTARFRIDRFTEASVTVPVVVAPAD
jgi:copper transport protein